VYSRTASKTPDNNARHLSPRLAHGAASPLGSPDPAHRHPAPAFATEIHRAGPDRPRSGSTTPDDHDRASRELHDRVGQDIAAAARRLELYLIHRDGDPRRADRHLELAKCALVRSMDDIRRISRSLRLSGRVRDVEHALRDYIDTADTGGADVRVTVTGDTTALPPRVAEELFLMVREGLCNALRHARARVIDVTLTVGPATVQAVVTDDGVGVPRGGPAAPPRTAGGVGLVSVRERCAALGGTAHVAGAPGRGTRLLLSLPLYGSGAHVQVG
jgi:signal transduction histidine kinase